MIMGRICLHLTIIEFRSCIRGRQWCGILRCHRLTASIKPRLLFTPCKLCALRTFFSNSFNLQLVFSACVVVVKWHPQTTSLCSYISSVPLGSRIVCSFHLKIEFRSCVKGRFRRGIFHYQWQTATIKPRLQFAPCCIRTFPFLSD